MTDEAAYVTSPHTQQVLRMLSTAGFHLPPRPAGATPAIPEDITELSDEELMVLFSQFTAWAEFAAAQLAIMAADEHEDTRVFQLEKAKFLATSDGKVTTARAAADMAAESRAQTASEAYAYRKLMEAISANYERSANLCSRELSRRLGGEANVRRRGGWQT